MTETANGVLRHFIKARYDDLLRRLSRRLGSRSLAEDVLHDAYVRLERTTLSAEVRQPLPYVLRMAVNIASNKRRQDRKLLNIDEVASALSISDDTPDPLAQLEQKMQVTLVREALEKLPARRRELILGLWFDDKTTVELAQSHGLALRTVQHEIKSGVEDIRRLIHNKGRKNAALKTGHNDNER